MDEKRDDLGFSERRTVSTLPHFQYKVSHPPCKNSPITSRFPPFLQPIVYPNHPPREKSQTRSRFIDCSLSLLLSACFLLRLASGSLCVCLCCSLSLLFLLLLRSKGAFRLVRGCFFPSKVPWDSKVLRRRTRMRQKALLVLSE